MARPEQSTTEDALVLHAGAGLPGRFDLGRIGEVTPEKFQVLVVHAMHLVDAEHANAPPSETPAAVIHWGTTASQIVVEGTLTDIAEKAKGIPPPAIIVVGQIVNLRQQLTWFDPAEGHKPPIPSSREEPQPDGSGEGENERLKPTTLEIL